MRYDPASVELLIQPRPHGVDVVVGDAALLLRVCLRVRDRSLEPSRTRRSDDSVPASEILFRDRVQNLAQCRARCISVWRVIESLAGRRRTQPGRTCVCRRR